MRKIAHAIFLIFWKSEDDQLPTIVNEYHDHHNRIDRDRVQYSLPDRSLGRLGELVVIRGGGHGTGGFLPLDVLQKIESFFEKHLQSNELRPFSPVLPPEP